MSPPFIAGCQDVLGFSHAPSRGTTSFVNRPASQRNALIARRTLCSFEGRQGKESVLQFLLSGVAIGAIYGLIGMALAITFYVTRIINFAQGQMMMATMMVTAELSAAGYPTWLAAMAGLAAACLLGVLSYLIAVRPILAINRFSFGWLVSTLGFAVIVENGAAYIWGPTSQAFPPMLKQMSFHLLGAVLTAQQLAAIVSAAILTAGFELVRRNTLFGKIGMATAADPEMATAIGINTTVVAIVAFAASALYAGVAGLLIGPTTFANPYLGDTFGTFGFIAMMIGGGTEKPIAAMFGGVLLGVCAEGANAMINSQASDWFPFIVLVIILIVSPRGLFSAGSLFRARRGGAVMGRA
jgi:branched-chain amino acid transport system permease protein